MKEKTSTKIIIYFIILLLAIFWGFPVLWIFISSFKPSELLSLKGLSLSFTPTIENYLYIFSRQPFASYLRNSLFITLISVILALIIGIPAAYSMSRFNTGGPNYSFWILSSRFIPPAVIVLPFFIIFQGLDMFNTWWALIIVYILLNISYVIWLLRSFFDDVPKEIEEAAIVDGATYLQVLLKITIPISKPGIISVTILSSAFVWNEFLFATILTLDKAAKTLPVAANDFVTGYAINWGPLFASGVLIGAPIFFFTLFIQKHIVRGLTLGAIK